MLYIIYAEYNGGYCIVSDHYPSDFVAKVDCNTKNESKTLLRYCN